MPSFSFFFPSNNVIGNVVTGELDNTTNPVTFSLQSGQGAAIKGTPFRLTIWNSTDFSSPDQDPDREIVHVPTLVGDQCQNAVRGQEGTSISAHPGSPAANLLFTAQAEIDLQDAIAVLASFVTQWTDAVNAGGNQLNDLADPTSAQDAATKNYVDTHVPTALTWSGDEVQGTMTLETTSSTLDNTPQSGQPFTAFVGGQQWINGVQYTVSGDTVTWLINQDGGTIVFNYWFV